MSYGTTTLIKNQFGIEATHGTAVAADTGIIGTVRLPSTDREVRTPRAGSGRRVPGIVDNAYVAQVAAKGITIDLPDPYFQALPWALSCCLWKARPAR